MQYVILNARVYFLSSALVYSLRLNYAVHNSHTVRVRFYCCTSGRMQMWRRLRVYRRHVDIPSATRRLNRRCTLYAN